MRYWKKTGSERLARPRVWTAADRMYSAPVGHFVLETDKPVVSATN